MVDENALRFRQAGESVAHLLPDADQVQIATLLAESADITPRVDLQEVVSLVVSEVLAPLTGAERAVRELWDEDGILAEVSGGVVVEILQPLSRVPEPLLMRALLYTRDDGPVFVRGTIESGPAVTTSWCKPWLIIERQAASGKPFGRAWKLSSGVAPGMLDLEDLRRADLDWFGGEPRPEEVRDILQLI